jgi:5'-3' exonuclease
MGRRDQNNSTIPDDISDKVSQESIVVKTNKIAIVDTDILLHWALSFIEETMSLEEAKQEAEKVLLNFENSLQAKAYVYFIKGKGNFRYTVATMKPYKGTRTSEPHKFYNEILEHMTNFRNCIKCDFVEADDMISIFHDERTVACTNDKDANQTAGDLYNFTKKTLVTLTEEVAWRTLWVQVITGDSTDNIPGIEGVGPAKAALIINDDVNSEDYPSAVLKAYIDKYGLRDGSDFFNENYQLIRMKTSSGNYIKERYKDIFLLIDYLHDLE